LDDLIKVQAETTERNTSVFSNLREHGAAPGGNTLPSRMEQYVDRRNRSEGIKFLSSLPDGTTPLVFFDPQYRGIMDYQGYGNEGARQVGRAALTQMSETTIRAFIEEITRVLRPKGHLMLWVDKFHLAEGVHAWFAGLGVKMVDLITWDKGRIGMGYRTRRRCEYLAVIQRLPLRAKGVWTAHNIPDVWKEVRAPGTEAHVHSKPVGLQAALIAATTASGDIVVDPAAGSYSVMSAAHSVGRRFLGCDLLE
jgi:site-specific DNA-methyltransferase (adenine-specific)